MNGLKPRGKRCLRLLGGKREAQEMTPEERWKVKHVDGLGRDRLGHGDHFADASEGFMSIEYA